MASEVEESIVDGLLDSRCNVDHLDADEKENRRELYRKYFRLKGHIKTAAGQDLNFDIDSNIESLRWKSDYQVSVATTSCDLCMEINACRPPGTLPFICLVNARPYQVRKEDGTSVCALCKIVRKGTKGMSNSSTCCRAIGGQVPRYRLFGPKQGGRDRKREREQRSRLQKQGKKKQKKRKPTEASNQDRFEDPNGSLFGSDLSSELSSDEEEEEEQEISIAAKGKGVARSVQKHHRATASNAISTTRSKTKHQAKKRNRTQTARKEVQMNNVISVSSDESDNEEGDQSSRTKSGRIIRPVSRYDGAEQNLSRLPTPSATMPASGSSQPFPRTSIIPESSRPIVTPNRREYVLAESTKGDDRNISILRQKCIKTCEQLLSFQMAELEAEQRGSEAPRDLPLTFR